MANKLNVKKKKTDPNKYLRGLSINEMEDIETAVEEALENPVGTFTAVSREMAYRLSNLNKMVKTIGVDTKYIRKVIDRIDKKIDGLDGASGFNLGDVIGAGAGALALRKWGAGLLSGLGNFTSKGAAGSKASTSMVEKGLSGPLSKAFGASLKGLSSLLTPLAVLDSQDDYVLEKTAPGREDSRNVRKEYGDELLSKARKEFQPWYGASNLNVEDKNDREYVRKYLEKHKLGTNQKAAPKKENKIPDAINKKLAKVIEAGAKTQIGSTPANIFREFNPTERAEIIRDRLKLMTEVPGMMGGGMVPGVGSGGAYVGSGSGGSGTSGGGTGGGGGGGWGDSSSSIPGKPSLTASEFMALEKAGMGGIGDSATKVEGGGQFRPVRELSSADLSDHVINTIAGEARMSSKEGVDAVINTMFNRLGTSGYGPSKTLEDVAMAGKGTQSVQYAGYRKATKEEAEMIRNRIKEIASGKVPDNTKGAQEFRADWYNGPWARKHPEKVNIGGNNFAKNTDKSAIGPYASYDAPKSIGNSMPDPLKTAQKVASAIPIVTKPPVGETSVVENQVKEAAVRKLPIQPKLKDTLAYAAAASGVDLVSVFSGGQAEKGSGKPRTGSIRHDNGNAADIYLYKDGRKLNMEDPEDQKVMSKFIANARAAGATGIGASPDYMGVHGIHVGYGAEGTWGANGKAANAPDWVKNAYAEGQKMQAVDATEWVKENQNKTAAVAETNKKNLRKDIIGYSRGLEKGETATKKKDATTTPVMKTSSTNYFDDKYSSPKGGKQETAPGKVDLPPTEKERQQKLINDHRKSMLDKESNPKPPTAINNKSFKEMVPDWVSPFDTNAKIVPTITKEEVVNEQAKAAMEVSNRALEQATAQASYMQAKAPEPATTISMTSRNKPPLENLPKTAKKKISNPTQKTPGSDSSKLNEPEPIKDDYQWGLYGP